MLPVAAVQLYDVVLWLHITAAVVAFGPTFAYGIYYATAIKRDARSLPAIIAATETVNRTLVTIGGILVLATGIYLTIDRWSFGDVFVNVGMIVVIVLLGVVHGFLLPNDRRVAAQAETDIKASGAGEVKLSTEFDRLTRRSSVAGMLAGLVIVLTIYFMTAKPFL